MFFRLPRRIYSFFLCIIICAFLLYSSSYSIFYDPTAPFSLFTPKLRQSSDGFELVGYFGTDAGTIANNSQSNRDTDFIYILYWTTVFGVQWPSKTFENCHRCVFTSDRNLLNRSSAVLFHARDILPADLPPIKYLNQKYIFYSDESPILTWITLHGALRKYFDWTLTYRTDSTFYCPYRYFESLRNESSSNSEIDLSMIKNETKWNLEIDLNKRTKQVLWIASNCDTHSKRERYVYELRKYVSIDIFGACGDKTCHRNDTYDCSRDIAKEYKFYISFENAVCTDYISEKFCDRMADGLVPIVLRRRDYDRLVPRDQPYFRSTSHENQSSYFFIAADDFDSPKELGDYLNYLHTHPNEYAKYSQWRQYWRIVENAHDRCFCNVCSKLYQAREYWRNTATTKGKEVARRMMAKETTNQDFDIHRWWYVNTCHRGMALKMLNHKWKSKG